MITQQVHTHYPQGQCSNHYDGVLKFSCKWQFAPVLNQAIGTGTPASLTEANCALGAQQ